MLNAVERLRTVKAIAIKESMGLLESLKDFALEAAAIKAYDIGAYHLHRAVHHIAEHIGREVLADLAHSAHHRVLADCAELVRSRASTHDCIIVEMDIARKLH